MAYELTLIGGGVSGVLTAINVLMQRPNAHVAIIEMQSHLGHGIAYSAKNDYHLLNVPVANMSAFAAHPTHFFDWLNQNGYKYRPEDFVPRRIYGLYLDYLCQTYLYACPNFVHIHQEAKDINRVGDKLEIVLKNGKRITSQQVVIATGNAYYKTLPLVANLPANHYHEKPWTESFLKYIKPQDDIIILGTGLTMVDTVVSLFKKRHKGKIHAISRNGYVPFPHYKPSIKYPDFTQELFVAPSFKSVVELIAGHCEKAILRNIPVGAVIDILRPHIQTLWKSASLQEKRWFAKELSPIWSVVRHRVPQRYSNLLMDLHFQRKQFEVYAGEVEMINPSQNTFQVTVVQKENHTHRVLTCHHIINCMGFDFDIEKHPDSLIANLIHKGLLTKDELGMGIHISEKQNIIDDEGNTHKNIYAMGSLLRGTLFETTALREIREQANQLSKSILEQFDLMTLAYS